MNLPTRGRGLMLVAVSTLALSLSACSGDDEPDVTPTSAAPSADSDVTTVTDLYESYWDARIATENAASMDAASFDGILDRPLVERHARKIDNYTNQKLKRVGAPVIGDIEVTVTGDIAKILACQNEDDWRAEVDGELIPPPEVFGNVGTGATAERRDDAWIITAFDEGDDSRCA